MPLYQKSSESGVKMCIDRYIRTIKPNTFRGASSVNVLTHYIIRTCTFCYFGPRNQFHILFLFMPATHFPDREGYPYQNEYTKNSPLYTGAAGMAIFE
jgi:hypothetical protein